MSIIISKQEQIESIIKQNVVLLMSKYIKETGGDPKKIFNVTRSEIVDFIKRNYLLEEIIPFKPQDGFFAEVSKSGFTANYQEYGHLLEKFQVDSKEGLLERFVDYLLIGQGLSKNIV